MIFEKTNERRKYLKQRNGVLTSILTPVTIENDIEYILKNHRSLIEQKDETNLISQKSKYFLSFGEIEERILDFVDKKRIFEKYKFLAENTERNKTETYLESLIQKLLGTELSNHKIIHRIPSISRDDQEKRNDFHQKIETIKQIYTRNKRSFTKEDVLKRKNDITEKAEKYFVLQRQRKISKKNWLKQNKKIIEQHFTSTNFQLMSQKEQLNFLKERMPDFEKINLETFRRFIKDEKIAKYEKIKIQAKNSETYENRQIRLIVLRFLFEFLSLGLRVVFFDESSVSSASFQQNAWFPFNSDKKIALKTCFKTVKMLATCSTDNWLTLQFAEKSNSDMILTFLEKTILHLIEIEEKRPIIILLDNAKSHKSPKVQQLVEKYDVILLYNAVASPSLNLVEQMFEVAKRGLRNSKYESRYQTVASLIQNVKAFGKKMIEKKFLKEMKNFRKYFLEDRV